MFCSVFICCYRTLPYNETCVTASFTIHKIVNQSAKQILKLIANAFLTDCCRELPIYYFVGAGSDGNDSGAGAGASGAET